MNRRARIGDGRVSEWRIHLGAHKTATTHLQNSLAVRADEIRRAGATFIPLEAVRPIFERYFHPAGRGRRPSPPARRTWPAPPGACGANQR